MTQTESFHNSSKLERLDIHELNAWKSQIKEIMQPAKDFMHEIGVHYNTSCKAVQELIDMVNDWSVRINKMKKLNTHEKATIDELITLRDHVRDTVIPEKQEYNRKLESGVSTAENVINNANKMLSKINFLEFKQNSNVYMESQSNTFSFETEIRNMKRDLATLRTLESLKTM